jgi:hypothetical protein
VDWQCPPTYYVYFDDDDNIDNNVINNNNNGSAYIIDAFLIDNLEVKGKENMVGSQVSRVIRECFDVRNKFIKVFIMFLGYFHEKISLKLDFWTCMKLEPYFLTIKCVRIWTRRWHIIRSLK